MAEININEYLSSAVSRLKLRRIGCEMDGLIPFVETQNGLIFYGTPVSLNGENLSMDAQNRTMNQRVEERILVEIVQIIQDMEFRYLSKRDISQHSRYTYNQGDVVVELGAYLGYYAMHIAEKIGPSGRVIAVELIPDNYRILKMNLQSNFPDNSLAINKGVYNKKGYKTAYNGHHQLCSFREDVISQYTSSIDSVEVETDTVDNILQENDIDKVDLMIIQINGSEIEALEGMSNSLRSIRNFAIAAPYSKNGANHISVISDLLRKNDFDVDVDNIMIFAKNRNL